MLDTRPRNAHRVALLEGVRTDEARAHLAAEDDHRNAVGISRSNARNGIGGAGAGRYQSYADLVRATRIGIGGVNRSLFVTHKHMFEVLLLVDLIVDRKNRSSRIAENVFDSFGMKSFDENPRAGHYRCGGAVLFCGLHRKIVPCCFASMALLWSTFGCALCRRKGNQGVIVRWRARQRAPVPA